MREPVKRRHRTLIIMEQEGITQDLLKPGGPNLPLPSAEEVASTSDAPSHKTEKPTMDFMN